MPEVPRRPPPPAAHDVAQRCHASRPVGPIPGGDDDLDRHAPSRAPAMVAAPAQAHRQPREHAPLPPRHQLHAVVSRRRPAARGWHLRSPDLAREHPLRRLPQAAPLAPHWKWQVEKGDCRGRPCGKFFADQPEGWPSFHEHNARRLVRCRYELHVDDPLRQGQRDCICKWLIIHAFTSMPGGSIPRCTPQRREGAATRLRVAAPSFVRPRLSPQRAEAGRP